MRRVRKPVLFIMTVVFLAGCVQKTDNTEITAQKSDIKTLETNEYVENTQNSTKIYTLNVEREDFLPQITINENDKTFLFSFDVLSSYLASGTYTENNWQLELKTGDGKYHYTFDITDDNTLKFNQENSSYIKLTDKTMGEEIKDGAEFIMEGDTGSATEQRKAVSANIKKCINEKLATFEEECELIDMWYDKEKSDRVIDSYIKYGKGSVNEVKRENIIVIMSDLKTGENTWSFEPHTIYTDWNWILVRDNPDSEWVVDDYGNE